jgi:hypothetical protein
VKISKNLPPRPFTYDSSKRLLKDSNQRNIATLWGGKKYSTALAALLVVVSQGKDPRVVVSTDHLPPGPLSDHFVPCGTKGGFLYVVDVNGKKIASCWATMDEKVALAQYIIDAWAEYVSA